MDTVGTVTKVVAAGAIAVGTLLLLGYIADKFEDKKSQQQPQSRAPHRHQHSQQPQQQKKRTETHDFDTNLLIAKELVVRNDPSAERFLHQLSLLFKQKKDWKRAGLVQAMQIDFYSNTGQETKLALIFLDTCKNRVKQNALQEIEDHIEQKLLALPWAHPASTYGFLKLLAKVQYYLGKDEKAQESVRKFLENNQTQKGYLLTGKLHFLADKFEDAERYFKEGLALEKPPSEEEDLSGLLHSHLSNLYSHLSRKEEASKSLAEALAGPQISYLTFSYYISTKSLEITREKEGHSMACVILKLRSKRQEGGPEDELVLPTGAYLVSRLLKADGSPLDQEEVLEKPFEVKSQKSRLVAFYFRITNRPTTPMLSITEIFSDNTKTVLLAEHKQIIFTNKEVQQ